MDKFELLCLLEAISNYAYDIHYTADGRFFFSDHLFSERLADVDIKDDFIETFFLGESQDAPESADIARKVADLTPVVGGDTQANFKKLRNLIINALVIIENYKGTKGEEDLLGSIAHILQRHNGLLYRQLTYKEEELQNDDGWQDIVTPEDTAQMIENNAQNLKENGGYGSGNFNHAGRPGEVGGSAEKGVESSVKCGKIKNKQHQYINADRQTLRRIFAYIDTYLKDKDIPDGTIHYAELDDGIYKIELHKNSEGYYIFKLIDVKGYDND